MQQSFLRSDNIESCLAVPGLDPIWFVPGHKFIARVKCVIEKLPQTSRHIGRMWNSQVVPPQRPTNSFYQVRVES